MGYFKAIVRTVFTVAGSIIGGPVGAAIGSAIGTLVTGGSFTDALISAGTSAIGSAVTSGLTAAGNAATSGLTSTGLESTVAGIGDDIAGSALSNVAPTASSTITSGVSDIAGSVLGDAATNLTDPLVDIAGTTLTNADVIGGVTGTALDNAAQDALAPPVIPPPEPEPGTVPLTPEELQASQQEAAAALLVNFDNPGLEQEFFNEFVTDAVVNSTKDVEGLTGNQFTNLVSDPNFLADPLETHFLDEAANIFETNPAFQTPTFIPEGGFDFASHLDPLQSQASEAVSAATARGNLSNAGSGAANQFLADARTGAETEFGRLGTDLAASFDTTFGGALTDVRDQTTQTIRDFDFFNNDANARPFDIDSTIAAGSAATANAPSDFASELDALFSAQPNPFNIQDAINAGGLRQGLVSGQPSNRDAALDALAARNLTKKDPRGVGVTGAGDF